MTSTDFVSILPLIVLVSWASILLLIDVFSKRFQLTVWLSGIGLAVTLIVLNLIPHQT
ncbi:MAG: hypothetical protein GWN33_01860, partial [Gammaproteobacteria bacterium]|nr:hypothetical protein [Gammaproteobacteria bacterium]